MKKESIYFGGSKAETFSAGFLFCLNKNNGKKRWSVKVDDSILVSPAIRNGRIYFGTSGGTIYCLDRRSGKKLWTYESEKGIYSTPVVHQGHVITGIHKTWYCLDAESGEVRWRYQRSKEISMSGAAVGEYIILPAKGKMHRINIKTGKVEWSSREIGPTFSLSADASNVFALSLKGILYSMNQTNGEIRWKEKIGTVTTSEVSPIINGDQIVIPSLLFDLLIIKKKNGKVVWEKKYDARIDRSAAIKDGKIVLVKGKFVICVSPDQLQKGHTWPTQGANTARTGKVSANETGSER